MEFEARDVHLIESSVPFAPQACNVSEAILQACDTTLEDEQLYERIKTCFSSVVKIIIQMQLAIANGCLQMRYDHFLASAEGLSHDALSRLRRAPALSAKHLFPSDKLREVRGEPKPTFNESVFTFHFSSTSMRPKW